MSAEGSFLVLGLDGTVISSGGDLQGDERFVRLNLVEKVNDCCKYDWTVGNWALNKLLVVLGVRQPSSSWSRLQARET